MKNRLKKLKYKVAKWLIHHSSAAMQIVIEYRNEVADYYERCLDVANDDMDKLERKRLDVLNNIRAEIVELQKDYHEYGWAYDDALEIIDKYRTGVSE